MGSMDPAGGSEMREHSETINLSALYRFDSATSHIHGTPEETEEEE